MNRLIIPGGVIVNAYKQPVPSNPPIPKNLNSFDDWPTENELNITMSMKNNFQEYLEWKNSGRRVIIKDDEINDFIEDTDELIYSIAFSIFFDPGTNEDCVPPIMRQFIPDRHKMRVYSSWRSSMFTPAGRFSLLASDYWCKWGPLFHLGDGEINMRSLINYCLAAVMWVNLWPLQKVNRDNEADWGWISIKSFFFNKVKNISPQPDYWSPYFDISNNEVLSWRPVERKEWQKIDKSHPWLFLPGIPDDFNEKGNLVWVRKAISKNIAEYIKAQRIDIKASLRDNQIAFYSTVDNRFLYWLLTKITLDRPDPKCACGCGKTVNPGSKWFSSKCQDKYKRNESKEKDSNRIGLKGTVRGWKNRGHISEKEMVKIYAKVDKMINNGSDEQMVRDYLSEIAPTNNDVNRIRLK